MSDNVDFPQLTLNSIIPPIPKGTKVLEHQVAGHVFGRQNGTKKNLFGFLQTEDGYILKPVQGPNKGLRELNFYKLVFLETKNSDIIELRKLLPTFYDIWQTKEHKDLIYLKIEDVTKGFQTPSIMDIKMGPVTYDCEADQTKILREKAKFPYLEIVGFQLVGIKVFSPVTNTYTVLDRYFLRALTDQTITTEGIHKYFNKPNCFDARLVKAFLYKLESIKEWFERQRSLSFIASSLLFVYDSEALARVYKHSCKKIAHCTEVEIENSIDLHCNMDSNINCDMIVEKQYKNGVKEDSLVGGDNMDRSRNNTDITSNEDYYFDHIDVKMIDFTHTFLTDQKDENYLTGLNSVISHLQSLI